MVPSSRNRRVAPAWSCLLSSALLVVAVAPALAQSAEERAPRQVPPLRLPRVAASATDARPTPTRPPPALSLSLSEGTPAAQTAPRPVDLAPLSDSRVDELLRRLPARRADGADPDGTNGGGDPPEVDAPRPAGRGEALEVLSVVPTGTTELAPYVTVLFSEPMVPLGIDGEPITGSIPARLEPAVAGDWRWLDVRTLRFEPEQGRLPGATEFSVRVPAGATALSGAALAADHVERFRTAGPRVLGGYPARGLPYEEGLADLLPTILLVFDQDVDRAAVLASATLEAGGASRPLRLVDRAELSDAMVAVVEDAGATRWAALEPTEPLPAGAPVLVTLGPGLTSLEGPLVADRAQELRFDVRRRLTVDRSMCPSEQRRCAPGPWWIGFSSPLDSAQAMADLVDVTPEVENLRMRASGRRLWLWGDFRPHTSYIVRLAAGIRDRFGQRLGRSTEVEAHFGRPTAFVQIPGAPFIVLDPASDQTIEVASRSMDAVELELFEVQPEDWSHFRRGLLHPYDERREAWPPEGREPVARWEVVPEDGGRGYSRIPVDLAPAFTHGGSHAVLLARGTLEGDPGADLAELSRMGRLRGRTVAIAWIQSTSFALGAVWHPEELVGWTVSLDDGEPVSSVRLELSGSPDGVYTDVNGLGRIPLNDGDSVLLGRRGNEVAILPALAAGQRGEAWVGDPTYPKPVWFTLTDRGLYRPGETVEAHGWVRAPAGAPRRDLTFPERIDSLRYALVAPGGRRAGEGTVRLGDTGSFHLTLPLDEDAASGSYRLEITPFSGGEAIDAWRAREGFSVEDFRRPEYEVHAEVDPGPHVFGGSFEARAAATYFDGAALGGGAVTWNAWTEASAWYPAGWSDWRFGAVEWWYDRAESGFFELEGRTDRSGGHALRVTPGTLREPVPVEVSLSVQIRDVNRLAGSADSWTLVHPAALAPGVRLDHNWVGVGEELMVHAVAVDLDGVPRPGTVPVVRGFLEPDPDRQVATRQEMEVPASCSPGREEEVDGQQFRPFRCVMRPPVSGRYRIEAEVADAQGRRSRTRLHVSVYGRGGGRAAPERLEIIPDRELYRPGDEARLLVESPTYPARGLLTVTRFGIRDLRAVVLDGPQTALDLPIHEEDVGGLTVRLELSAPTGTNEVQSATVTLNVDAEDRRLDVALTPDRPEAEPGDEVTVAVEALDAQGAPAGGGQVTMWAVDEAILSLSGYRLVDVIARMYASGPDARPGSSLPQRLVRWARRPLGPGTVSAEVFDADTGRPEGPLRVTLDGDDVDATFDGGEMTVHGVSPGRHRLTLFRNDAVVFDESILVPDEGLDLGTLLLTDSNVNGLALNEVLVTGTTRRRAVGNSVSYLSAAEVAPPAFTVPGRVESAQELVDLRHDFRALVAFEANVPLDAAGRAEVTLRLPDTMTRYRLFAVATQGPRRFGMAESSITASRDLVVRASLPRVLHPGDRPELPVVVQNASDRYADVEVVARADGLELTGERGFEMRLPPGAHREVRFPASADRLGDRLVEVLAVARLEGEDDRGANGGRVELTDAVELRAPVSPALAPRAVSVYERVQAGSPLTLTVETPARATPGFGGVEAGVSTTLLMPAVDAVRNLYLGQLLWPEATAARLMGLAGIDPVLEVLRAADLPNAEAIRERARLDVERLLGWLRPYMNDRTPTDRAFLSRFSALNGVHALLVALESASYDVYDGWRPALQRLVADAWRDEWVWISRRPGPAFGYRTATAAYAVHLSWRLGGVLGPEWTEWVVGLEPADLPVEVIAWLIGPMSEVPELAATRDEFFTELTNRALTTGATATFRQGGRAVVSGGDAEWERLVLASSRRSDAVALLALLEQAPDHPLIPGLVRGLLGGRDGTTWGSAHENAWVLLSLGRYADRFEAGEDAQALVRVALDDRPLGEPIRLDSTHLTAVAEAPLPPPGREARLAVESQGSGSLYMRATVRYAPVVTVDTPAEERGFVVSRSYEAVDDSTDVRLDADGTWRVRAGARVRVRVTLSALARRYQVQLTDPIPGGFEALNPRLRGTGFNTDRSPPPVAEVADVAASAPLWGTIWTIPYGWDLGETYFRWRAARGQWASHEQLRDDRMEAYAPMVLAGTYQTTYLVRATTPGTFLAPPARVEETEHPETFGQAGADRIVVEGGDR